MSTLRLVLPDQLSKDNPVFDNIKYEDILLFYEPIDTFYENSHHKQKIVYLISSMRSFVAKNKHKKIIHKKKLSLKKISENELLQKKFFKEK